MAAAHVIETLEFDVGFRTETDAWAERERWEDLAAGRALDVIGEVFDDFADARSVWRLDRLEVDLGPSPNGESEAEFEARLRAGLRRSLERLGLSESVTQALPDVAPDARPTGPAAGVTLATPANADLELLWRLARFGRLPWQVGRLASVEIGDLVARVLDSDGAAFARALREAEDMPRLVARIARQWPPEQLGRLWRLLGADAAAGVQAPPASPGGEAAWAWEQALLSAAAGPGRDPQAVVYEAARFAFRLALGEGRVSPLAWSAMLRQDPDFLFAELGHLDRRPAALARLIRSLTAGQWRDLLAVAAAPAERDLLTAILDHPGSWRLEESRPLDVVAEALQSALLAHLLDHRGEVVSASAAVEALIRASARLHERPVAEAARLLATQWTTGAMAEGPTAAIRPRLLPILAALAGAPFATQAPGGRDPPPANPDWDAAVDGLDAGDLDDEAWDLLRRGAPGWLRQRLGRLGARAAWRGVFAARLSPMRLLQLLALWLTDDEARWLQAAASLFPTVSSLALQQPAEQIAVPDAAVRRWLLDALLLAPRGGVTAPALLEAAVRRQARAEGRPAAESARRLAAVLRTTFAGPIAMSLPDPTTTGAHKLATARSLTTHALARLESLDRDRAGGTLAAAETLAAERAGAGPARALADLPPEVGSNPASLAWRRVITEGLPVEDLEPSLALWLDADDARWFAAWASALAGVAQDTDTEPYSAFVRRWVIEDVLASGGAPLPVDEVVQRVARRAAGFEDARLAQLALRLEAARAGLADRDRARLAAILQRLQAVQVGVAAPAPGTGADRRPTGEREAAPRGQPGGPGGAVRPDLPSTAQGDERLAAGRGRVSDDGPFGEGGVERPAAGASGDGAFGEGAAAARAPGDGAGSTRLGASARRNVTPLPHAGPAGAGDGPSDVSEIELVPTEAGLRRLAGIPDAGKRQILERLRPDDGRRALDLLDRLAAAWRSLPPETSRAPRRPRDVAWGLLLRDLIEEDRLFDAAGLAERWFAAVTDGAAPEDVRQWREALTEQLGAPAVLAVQAPQTEQAAAAVDPFRPGAAARLSPSFSAPWAEARWRTASPGPSPGEALYVANAGLVLVGAYIPMLFERLELTDAGAFRDEARAAHAVDVLQLVAEDAEPAPEHELILNKLICGLDLDAPLLRETGITAHEREVVHGLLEAVIQRWSIIGETSVAGLRESFLQRRGALRDEVDAWRLAVEPRAFDMLIDQIPWGFGTLKLPWMSQVLHVDWR